MASPGHVQWLISFSVQLIPGGLFALGIPFFIKQSLRLLIARNRRDEAIKNSATSVASRPRTRRARPHRPLGRASGRRSARDFGKGFLLRRMIITTSLFIWQNGTG
ncbi:hypothetical protein JCM1840_005298 [Sporobolomyces johnsonii]